MANSPVKSDERRETKKLPRRETTNVIITTRWMLERSVMVPLSMPVKPKIPR